MTCDRKDLKMHRKTADRLLRELTERIAVYNDNPWKPYAITRAVVFGSYVNNPERELLSDLDIGVQLDPRYQGKISKTAFELEYEEILERCPSYRHRWEYPHCLLSVTYYDAIIYLRKRSGYISIHDIDSDKAIFTKRIQEIDVGEIDRSTEWYDETFGDFP